MSRTEGLWRVVEFKGIDKRIKIVAPGMEHAPLAWVDNDDTDEGPANAEFICLAVNTYSDLKEALQRIAKPNEYGDPTPREAAFIRDIARDALNKADAALLKCEEGR